MATLPRYYPATRARVATAARGRPRVRRGARGADPCGAVDARQFPRRDRRRLLHVRRRARGPHRRLRRADARAGRGADPQSVGRAGRAPRRARPGAAAPLHRRRAAPRRRADLSRGARVERRGDRALRDRGIRSRRPPRELLSGDSPTDAPRGCARHAPRSADRRGSRDRPEARTRDRCAELLPWPDARRHPDRARRSTPVWRHPSRQRAVRSPVDCDRPGRCATARIAALELARFRGRRRRLHRVRALSRTRNERAGRGRSARRTGCSSARARAPRRTRRASRSSARRAGCSTTCSRRSGLARGANVYIANVREMPPAGQPHAGAAPRSRRAGPTSTARSS